MGLFDHIKSATERLDPKPLINPNSATSVNSDAPITSQAATEAETNANEAISPSLTFEPTDPAISSSEYQNPLASDDAPKFSVGIDLGTTNCVLSYIELNPTAPEKYTQAVMAIPQLSAPGLVEEPFQLPSFLYLAHPAEIPAGSTSLPWTTTPKHLVGEIARSMGTKTPIRLVSSAKSWLCHAGVDCKTAILPVAAPEEIECISPFEATQAYLEHLLAAWTHRFPLSPLTQQDLTITVPASFDPAARELTIEAARALGLGHCVLLEEPQAALYSWIERSQGDWRKQSKVGDIILVVDIGGGTTDLSLITVTQYDGNLELTRIAVGDHILLGGDNMDLALAYTLKAKLETDGKRLEHWQIQGLTQSCREAKEQLFSQPELDTYPIVVASRGSSLIGASLRTELNREELNRILLEGFFPKVSASEKPASRQRSGLRSVGLPYAQDAGITRHLAAFLSKQINASENFADINLPSNASFLHPTAILLNGGVLKAPVLAERLLETINSWLQAEQAPTARLLGGADFDLAVARGAAYFGFVRKGDGVRIKGGTAAAYYVGIESAMPAVPGLAPEMQALCIAPFGMEEGTEEYLPDDEFGLVVGEPVRFRFFESTVRREDQVGTRLEHWSTDELAELDEIEITLPEEGRRAGEIVRVQLCAAVSEVGTLVLQAVSQQDATRWRIQFEVRAGEDH